MKNRYLSFPSAALLLMLWLFSSCQQQDKAVKPDEAVASKLTYLAEKLEKADLPEAEQKKVAALFNALTFEESETLIDLRYQQYLKRSDANAERGAQLVAFRHKLNQAAQERKGKSFYQLDFNNSEEILRMVEPQGGKGNAQSLPGARTASECFAGIVPPCTVWKPTGSIYVTSNTIGKKEIPGTYLGQFTVQCDGQNTYQKDCDYLFRYIFSKIYAPSRWKIPPPPSLFLEGTNAATKLIDNNPNRIDCGTYTLQVLHGKGRIDANYWTPQDAASIIKLTLNISVQTGNCYTGTWGTEKWYWYGVYAPEWDNWGARNAGAISNYSPCACTVPTPNQDYLVL